MPAPSKAQRRLAAIAEHDPDAVYPSNRGILGMAKGQLHEFAATKEKGLPDKVAKVKSLKGKAKA